MRTRLRRDEQVERNRNRLLDAARTVFLSRGYIGATLDEISEHAGFSKGLVYSQFDSKADLFFALLERRITARAAENAAATRTAKGFQGLLELLRIAERDDAAEPEWGRLLVEFRIVAARDRQLNRRYAAAHARTVDMFEATVDELFARAGHKPPIPARELAELALVVQVGGILEQAADPSAKQLRSFMALLRLVFEAGQR